MQKGYALVTGASSGIGVEIARQLAARGYPVILTARRLDRLEALKKEITATSKTDVICISCDLSTEGAAQSLFDEVQKKNLQVDILVNNAGVGIQGIFTEMDIATMSRMFVLNIHSLTFLTQLFAREMQKRKHGHVLQVSSLAAFIPTPYVASYAATKSYVRSFSDALRYELRGSGVSVTTLYPGITPTEFNDVAHGKTPPLMDMSIISAARVAQVGIRAMFRRKRAAIPGFINKLSALFNAILPGPWVTAMAGKMMRDANK
jgi:short-subunit dehydrogenase